MNIKQTLKKTALGAAAVVTLGGATLAASTADAHPNAGAAVGAGILGFALGATIASAHHPYYNYGYAPAYYGPGYAQSCRSFWHWSPYYGRYVRSVRCY
jgi:hypothetical protein